MAKRKPKADVNQVAMFLVDTVTSEQPAGQRGIAQDAIRPKSRSTGACTLPINRDLYNM
jgi:hypothetical protein